MVPMSRMRFAILSLSLAAASPVAAGEARPQVIPATVTSTEGLTSQEREMLDLAVRFAARCAAVLDGWIDKEVAQERLFSFLYYPVPATDPPKFTTDWDRLSDRDVLPIDESVLEKSPLIQFALMVDRNGYLPSHNQRYSQPLTGNLANDLVNNRTKRIFNDRTGLA